MGTELKQLHSTSGVPLQILQNLSSLKSKILIFFISGSVFSFGLDTAIW